MVEETSRLAEAARRQGVQNFKAGSREMGRHSFPLTTRELLFYTETLPLGSDGALEYI